MIRPGAKLVWTLKLTLGLGLLWALFAHADIDATFAVLASVRPAWLLALLIMPHLLIALSCLKWQALLAAGGARVGLGPLFVLYMIGSFFSNFLPSMVGGDVVRTWQLSRTGEDPSVVIASTLLERFAGLAALITLLPMALLHLPLVREWPALGWIVLAVSLAFVAVCGLAFSGSDRIVQSDSRHSSPQRALALIRRSRDQVRMYRGHPRVLGRAYLLSILFYLGAGCSAWFGTLAIGAGLSLPLVVSVTPLILFAALMPVSVNGLGVLEAGYVLVLGLIGLQPAEALSVAILMRLRILLTAALGGALFLAWQARRTESPTLASEIGSDPTHV